MIERGLRVEWHLLKPVILAKAGIQRLLGIRKVPKALDSCLRRNDEKWGFVPAFRLSQCHSGLSRLSSTPAIPEVKLIA